MNFISIEVHDEGFQSWVSTLEMQISVMKQTLINIAHIVELSADKYVPIDTRNLRDSFFVMPFDSSSMDGMIEVEFGYSPIDPRDGFNYGEYTHTGIDYRTGNAINWHRPSAQAEYLEKGLIETESEIFREIEGDYLSLFRSVK